MGVQVTIVPHVVIDKQGKRTEFDQQFQIFCGQRVLGYLGKREDCLPKLIVGELSQELKNAVMLESQKTLRELFPEAELRIDEAVQAAKKPLTQPRIGDKPAKGTPRPADAEASAELEKSLEQ